MNPPEGERLVRKILKALFDKINEVESRQQSDLETNIFQNTRNLCLSSITLVVVFGKSPWARLSSK